MGLPAYEDDDGRDDSREDDEATEDAQGDYGAEVELGCVGSRLISSIDSVGPVGFWHTRTNFCVRVVNAAAGDFVVLKI